MSLDDVVKMCRKIPTCVHAEGHDGSCDPEVAPEGQIYVCAACGKTSKKVYGGESNSSWDESCMLNAVRCFEQKNADGSWKAAP